MTRMSGSSRRADMFTDLADDPRETGGPPGHERATLVEYLRCQRLTLEMNCSGLDATDLASDRPAGRSVAVEDPVTDQDPRRRHSFASGRRW